MIPATTQTPDSAPEPPPSRWIGPPRSHRRAGRGTTLAVVGIGTIAVVAAVLDVHAVRVTAALAGCLLLPGLGWARRLRLRDLGDTAALSVVLSLSATALVATTMVVLGRWSSMGGLVALSAITVLGFVPIRAVGARAAAFLFGRPLLTADGIEEERAAEARAAEEEWRDWYADVRQQVDEERRRREEEAAAAEQEWRDWVTQIRHRDDDQPRRTGAEVEAARPEWWDGLVGADDVDEASGGGVADGPERPRTDSAVGHR